jgi:predicted metalloprotease
MAFELQADCYAGTWAKNADDEHRLEEGDLQEALGSAMAVGDFDAGRPGHHGTPEQRKAAFTAGFESGDPGTCNQYLQS